MGSATGPVHLAQEQATGLAAISLDTVGVIVC